MVCTSSPKHSAIITAVLVVLRKRWEMWTHKQVTRGRVRTGVQSTYWNQIIRTAYIYPYVQRTHTAAVPVRVLCERVVSECVCQSSGASFRLFELFSLHITIIVAIVHDYTHIVYTWYFVCFNCSLSVFRLLALCRTVRCACCRIQDDDMAWHSFRFRSVFTRTAYNT